MFVVDTNILVYAADRDADHHEVCYERLEDWRRGRTAWYLTWGICYEFLRVVTHPAVLRAPWTTPAAMEFLGVLLDSPGLDVLRPTERHASVLREVVEEVSGVRGSKLHDLHTAVLMSEHGIRTIQTHDMDFHHFGFLEVVDPVRG